ncbi:XTP/dITP diphosphatase [bacterium]|nr:RdgB/HAM1 family non-canonical purine NTP pyrophosphatase [bacterium]NSW96234.1 RdgB/HAM1 family non-canonical purine NTP pyrophosphatase [bacterium]GIR29268.1 MAG: XTP/dITP diphosphatase [bacterium]|tara:strand:+ start:1911 stop:2498 length:588 start_codon:yes stop_codon:yes gene_type:complete
MQKVLIGTNNKGKVKEYKFFLSNYFHVLTPSDIGINFDVAETGSTYEENSLLKLEFLRRKDLNMAILCDDSGLEIESLNNEPGVFSARYAGEDCSDQDNIDKVLRNLNGKKDRKAKFICVVSFFWDKFSSFPRIFRGECHGSILENQSGNSGFGYDPIFYYENLSKTFANLSEDEKNKISHRAMAMKELFSNLNF